MTLFSTNSNLDYIVGALKKKKAAEAAAADAARYQALTGQDPTMHTAASGAYPGSTQVNYGGILQNAIGSYMGAKKDEEATAQQNAAMNDWERVLNARQQQQDTQPSDSAPMNTTPTASNPQLQPDVTTDMAGGSGVLTDISPKGALTIDETKMQKPQQAALSSMGVTSPQAAPQEDKLSKMQLIALQQMGVDTSLLKPSSSLYGKQLIHYMRSGDTKSRPAYLDPDTGEATDAFSGAVVPPDAYEAPSATSMFVNDPATKFKSKEAEVSADEGTKIAVAAQAALPIMTSQFAMHQKQLDSMLNDPGLDSALSAKGLLSGVHSIVNPDAANFYSKLSQIDGQAWLEGFKAEFKGAGAGAMSDAEGGKLSTAYNRIRAALKSGNKTYFQDAVNEFKQTQADVLSSIQERAAFKYNKDYTPPSSPEQPTVVQPKTREDYYKENGWSQ